MTNDQTDFAIVRDGALVLPTSDKHRASKLIRLGETESGAKTAFESLLSRSSRGRKLSAHQTTAARPVRRRKSSPPTPPLTIVVSRPDLLVTGAIPVPDEPEE